MIKLKEILCENIQLADKIYFNTGKLSIEDREVIMNITHGDNYSKILSDMLFHLKEYDDGNPAKLLKLYAMLKNYNKNIIPLELTNINDVRNIPKLMNSLFIREDIITELRKLPSIAIRNLKSDIRKNRDTSELNRYKNDLQYFIAHLAYLSNKDESSRNKILQKMFRNNVTLDDLLTFVEDKQNLIAGEETSAREFIDIVSENEDMELIYNKKNILVIKVTSPGAIKEIGCNSLWCFTYGRGLDYAYKTWNSYSTNGIVYVIINFNEQQNSQDFMSVVIHPINFNSNTDDDNYDDASIFDFKNDPQYRPLDYLKRTIGINTAKRILTFKND